MKHKTYSTAKTVVKAFTLLEMLSETQPAKISTLISQLGWTRSNLYRILETLQDIGYVTKSNKSEYRLSMKTFVLGSSVLGIDQLSTVAQPYMARLSEMTQETINLAIMYAGSVLYIEKIQSPHYLKLDQPIGKTDPLHCTSLGKALLSGLDDEQLEKLIQSLSLIPFTKNTIKDPMVLMQAIREVRQKGYAEDFEELSLGIHCIASPVRDHSRNVVAAIGISGPTVRLTKEKIDELKTPIMDVAGRISEKMGYRPIVRLAR